MNPSLDEGLDGARDVLQQDRGPDATEGGDLGAKPGRDGRQRRGVGDGGVGGGHPKPKVGDEGMVRDDLGDTRQGGEVVAAGPVHLAQHA